MDTIYTLFTPIKHTPVAAVSYHHRQTRYSKLKQLLAAALLSTITAIPTTQAKECFTLADGVTCVTNEPTFTEDANTGSFEGGTTGTADDAGVNNSVPVTAQVLNGAFNVPTNSLPSPLFGAQPFSQQMLRFEEFGTQTLPTSFPATGDMGPPTVSAQVTPTGADLDSFIATPIFPQPTRLSNDLDENVWKIAIEGFLGRSLIAPPAEGRAPGEAWSHQRWSEFPPKIYSKTMIAESRTNGGARDTFQDHGYSMGEFGPDGLYHNTTGNVGSEGTTAGINIKFHPNFPVQVPHALWTFDGTFPPKLLKVRYGEGLLMRIYNELPIDPAANMGFGLHTIAIHEHNGHTPAESDGYTNAFSFPGQYFDYRWPIILAGHDSVNTSATDPRAGAPDGSGGIINIPGDYRETMSTHWFHDHMLDFTAQNVYKGMAAMMNYYSAIDRGNEIINDGINLRFPSGSAMDWGNRDYDVNLLLAAKAWDLDGQLWFNIFNTNGFLGDVMTVNWLYKPYMDVRARRYRFRILNGAVSRYFKVALVTEAGTPVPFHMIANDGNIMEHAVAFDGTNGTTAGVLPMMGIAERYDIIVDFSQFQPGDKLYMVNLLEHKDGQIAGDVIPLADVLSGAYRPETVDLNNDGIADEWIGGDPVVGTFLEFRVQPFVGDDPSMNPANYVAGKDKMIPLPRPSLKELANATHREFIFKNSGTDDAPWTIRTDGGDDFSMDPRRLTAAPNLGDLSADGLGHVEIWTLKGGGGWSHPIHVHFEEGIILKRDGLDPPVWEQWARKDVYRLGSEADSSREIEFAIRFREFAGTYMEHCHNTQHEDHSMLLRWDIENPGQVNLMPTPIPTWDGVEYVDTHALPTFRTGDGIGPTFEDLSAVGAYYASRRFWRIRGTSTTPGNTITVHVGADLTGPVLRTAVVDDLGRWGFNLRRAQRTTPTVISIVSNAGHFLLNIPITIR